MSELKNIRIRRFSKNYFRTDNEVFDFLKEMRSPAPAAYVYFFLSRTANGITQKCYPGYQYIADHTGLSRVQVGRMIRDLERRHLIAISRISGRSNTYWLLHKTEWRLSDEEPRAVSDRYTPTIIEIPVPVSKRGTNKIKQSDLYKQTKINSLKKDISELATGKRIRSDSS